MVYVRKDHSFLKFFWVGFPSGNPTILLSFKKKDQAFNKFLTHINLQTNSENAAGSSRGRPAMSRAC